jgi:hypothetical protein
VPILPSFSPILSLACMILYLAQSQWESRS